MPMTQSGDYFTGLRDGLTDLALDWGRSRLIDVETTTDDQNITDNADLANGLAGAPTNGTPYQVAPAGVPITTWALIGGLVVAGVYALKKFL